MANMALTLCHQTDKMMCAYIEKLEKRFVTEGGIKKGCMLLGLVIGKSRMRA